MAEYTDILKQAPIVGMFMIFMWHSSKVWLKHLQDRDERFAGIIDSITSKNEAVLARVSDKLEGALNGTAVQINVLSKLLLYHDATVRGVNPDIKGGTSDIERMLRETLATIKTGTD